MFSGDARATQQVPGRSQSGLKAADRTVKRGGYGGWHPEGKQRGPGRRAPLQPQPPQRRTTRRAAELRAVRQVDRPLPIEARSSAAIGPAEGRVCDGRSCSESCCEREGVLGERTRSFMRVPERGAVRVRHACNYSTEAHTLHITPVQFQNAT